MDIKINLQKAMTELKKRGVEFNYIFKPTGEETIFVTDLKAVDGVLFQYNNNIGRLTEMPDDIFRKLSRHFKMLNGAEILIALYNNRAPMILLSYEDDSIITNFDLQKL